jgi:hypothetical protein
MNIIIKGMVIYYVIVCIIDVFSRKVWTYPMKSKSLSDSTPAI